jgi:tetratricopeptide (TPR) repeat protein
MSADSDQYFCQEKINDTYYQSRLAYVTFMSNTVEANSPQTFLCPDKLPPSQYIFTRSLGYLEIGQQDLFEVATAAAYDLDRIWERPLWRATNAQYMAGIYASHLDWDKSFRAYERAIESFNAEPALDPVYLARTYSLMASTAQLAGQDFQSLSYYEDSIRSYPQVPQSLIQEYATVVWRLLEQDIPSVAERILTLTANKQTDYIFLYQLATALVDASSSNIEAVKEIIANLETTLPISYFEAVQGAVARQETDFSTAQKLFESALARGDIEDVNLQADILSRLAIVYILDTQFVPGIEAQEKVVSLKPDSSLAWYQLALYYEGASQINSAREAIAQAIILHPENEIYLSFAQQLKTMDE